MIIEQGGSRSSGSSTDRVQGRFGHIMEIAIIDQPGIFRDSLVALLGQIRGDDHVVGADELCISMASAEDADANLLIVCRSALNRPALQDAEMVAKDCPDSRLMFLLDQFDIVGAAPAVEAGARGFILKSAPAAVLSGAIDLVASGEMYFPSAATRAQADREQPQTGLPERSLSDRQRQVLQLMADGMSNNRIADALGIRESTVKNHVQAVLRALKASTRTQAVVTAFRQGLVDTEQA
ncbi:MAG: response regulator transcription factor [Minwuia sp.]|nr:response regulator transcription factor [Minwuia sp.]